MNAHLNNQVARADLVRFSFDDAELAYLERWADTEDLFTPSKTAIMWEGETVKALLSGGWLEIIVADNLRGTDFRDITLGVEVAKSTSRAGSQTEQEIDVMAMREHKLLMIECKTVNWKSATQASEALYKLDSLSDIGGLNTVPVFVSLYDLPPAAKTRAAEKNIRVIAGQEALLHLKAHLTRQLI